MHAHSGIDVEEPLEAWSLTRAISWLQRWQYRRHDQSLHPLLTGIPSCWYKYQMTGWGVACCPLGIFHGLM